MIELTDIRFAWPGAPVILDGISLSVREGEKLVLLGANGCGKSTLLKLMNGTLSYDFTIPMAIFAAFGVAAVLIAVVLKVIDKKKGYGLEQANIKK